MYGKLILVRHGQSAIYIMRKIDLQVGKMLI